jgi:carbamoyl-phosphate synthase large subunit
MKEVIVIFEKLLITGCGGDISLALARIARDTGLAKNLIGTDIHNDHAGFGVFDHCEVIPRACDPKWLKALYDVARRHKVDAIVPMSEAELARLLTIGFETTLHGFKLITANRFAIATGLDKYETFERLSAAGLGVARTEIVSDKPTKMLPVILKPRSGQGSKGLQILETEDAVRKALPAHGHDKWIWQELLVPDDQEYTCGLYRARTGDTRTIVLRRTLVGGLTGKAVVCDPKPFNSLLHGVAEALELRGAINVQLRLTSRGPKVFEINPRFSSTVMFRHKLGFMDFIWAAYEQAGLSLLDYTPPPVGTRMYRTAEEVIFFPEPRGNKQGN